MIFEEFFNQTPSVVWITIVLWAVLVSYFIVEFILHRRVLRRIPVRIHVNGTRGKTSVVRLIAAGLRAGGKKVYAKSSIKSLYYWFCCVLLRPGNGFSNSATINC